MLCISAHSPVALPADRQVNAGKESMYTTYILKSKKDGKYYTGFTQDVARRVKQHNAGHAGTSSTKNRGPFEIVYTKSFPTRSEARKHELYLKSGTGREWRNTYLKNIPR